MTYVFESDHFIFARLNLFRIIQGSENKQNLRKSRFDDVQKGTNVEQHMLARTTERHFYVFDIFPE